jgi:hypothetical protein
MQKCLECGKVFEDYEVDHWREGRGEFWGVPVTVDVSGCPWCRGVCEEAHECESCGKYFTLDELDENHLCEDCREDSDEEE